MAVTLAAVFTLDDKFSMKIKKIIQSQNEYEKAAKKSEDATERFNKKLGESGTSAGHASSGMDSMIGKIAKLVSVATLAKKALDLMFSAVNTAALQETQETTFQALLHNDAAGTALYQWIAAYDKTSQLNREDIAKGVTSLLPMTRDMDQIKQFVKMMERLYAKDPSQGSDGAAFALKELLSGDTVSARNRYGITGVSGDTIRDMVASGDIQGALDYISDALDRFGATQEVVDRNFTNLTTQVNMFKSNLLTAISEQAQPVMEQLSRTVQQLNADMEAGKYQPFINLMVNGFEAIGNAIAWVAQNAEWLIPVVGGLVTAMAAYNTVMAAYNAVMAVATVLQNGFKFGIAGLAAGVVAVTAGVAATTALMSAAVSDVEAKSANAAVDEEAAYKNAQSQMDPLGVEITNTDPISVKGTVDIEQENLRYMADMAGMKFFAQYSVVQPQMVIQNQNVTKEADWEEGYRKFAEFTAEQMEVQPEGVY